jgi:DNA repair protein RadC
MVPLSFSRKRTMQTLSDADLLGVLLGHNASGLLQDGLASILKPAQAFVGKSSLVVQDVEATYGDAPLAKVAAALELSRRFLALQLKQRDGFRSPGMVKDYLRQTLGHLEHEAFQVLYLDAQHCLIESEEAFRGTVNQTAVYPREIAKRALQLNALNVIVSHNHPSGEAEPSAADNLLTKSLKECLALFDIRLLDHIIVAGTKTLSFAERALL